MVYGELLIYHKRHIDGSCHYWYSVLTDENSMVYGELEHFVWYMVNFEETR